MAVAVFHGMTVGIISGTCQAKVHTYAKSCPQVNQGPASSDGKTFWNLANLMPGKARQSTDVLQTFSTAHGWLPGPPVLGPPPGAWSLLPQCHPTQAPPGLDQVACVDSGSTSLSLGRRHCFCWYPHGYIFALLRSTSRESTIYFAGSSPCLGSLWGEAHTSLSCSCHCSLRAGTLPLGSLLSACWATSSLCVRATGTSLPRLPTF